MNRPRKKQSPDEKKRNANPADKKIHEEKKGKENTKDDQHKNAFKMNLYFFVQIDL